MTRASKSPLRSPAVVMAALTVVFSFGVAGGAVAEPSSTGSENSATASDNAAHAEATPAAPTDTAPPTQPATDTAPPTQPGNGNGNANGHANSNETTTTSTTTSPSGPSATAAQKKSVSTAGSSDTKKAEHRTSGTAGTVGTPPAPQPLSNADQNTGGANGQCANREGPYCGTTRTPSLNGKSTIDASTGKPCAGCVGKADNKNPQGQFPNASDANNGYECDGNQGIAKGNPAHTSCVPTTPVVPKPPVTPVTPVTPVKPVTPVTPVAPVTPVTPVTPAAPGAPVVLPAEEIAPPAVHRPPTVKGVEQLAPQPPAGVEQLAAPSGVLPPTGASVMTNALAATGLGLLLLGAVVLLRRKAHQG